MRVIIIAAAHLVAGAPWSYLLALLLVGIPRWRAALSQPRQLNFADMLSDALEEDRRRFHAARTAEWD